MGSKLSAGPTRPCLSILVDLSKYMGIAQFGQAYQIMLEKDTHAPGSVDRVLAERMICLCTETAPQLYTEYTPAAIHYQEGSRPRLERYVTEATKGCSSEEEKVGGIAAFCSRLQEKVEEEGLDEMVVGGLEEEVVDRGSDWCPDVARVACVLCQVAGIPARLVMLFNTDQAYSGHVIIEAYRSDVWGAVDPLTNVVYRVEGEPATAWDLMMNPELVKAHWRGPSTPYTTPGQFRSGGISNYFVWDEDQYDYSTSRINEYYRAILKMSLRGWPGGLRWIHGENNT